MDNPDKIVSLKLDRRTLPRGVTYTEGEPEKRQVFDVLIKKVVTEYQAQVLIGDDGSRHCADFPEGVSGQTQYGPHIKSQVVYASGVQMTPVERITEQFQEQAGLPISAGFVSNCNLKAFELLERFEMAAKIALLRSFFLHADETSVNINAKRHWLHCASNDKWTLIAVHQKRGREAMNEIGIIPAYKGTLCHDHWKPYLSYKQCDHSLCNAHHLRELERAFEQDGCLWAEKLSELLLEIRENKEKNQGPESLDIQNEYRKRYRKILRYAGIKTPAPKAENAKGKVKKSKARNLLERLREFEDETLLFMTRADIAFSNNQAERDFRMSKVQQKVSGCFRSLNGAEAFSRLRSFVSTCSKHGVSRAVALRDLFMGKLPDFVNEVLITPE